MARANRMTEVRVGLFVVAALTLLLLTSLWLAGSSLMSGGRVGYRVLMPASGGVAAGDRVRISGVEVGRVEAVELDPGAEHPVRFEVAVEDDVRLTAGSSARITSDGLLGGSYLELIPGPADAAQLPPRGEIVGQRSYGLEEAVAQVGALGGEAAAVLTRAEETLAQLAGGLEPVLARLELLLSDDNLGSLSSTLAAVERTAEGAGPRLDALLARAEQLAAKLEEGSDELPELATEIRGLTGDLRQAVGPDGARLAGVLDAAEQTFGRADGALTTVEDNRGDLEATIRDLRDAAAGLKELSRALSDRPSSLLGLRPERERKPGEGS